MPSTPPPPTQSLTLPRIHASLVARMLVSVAAFALVVLFTVGAVELWREREDLAASARAAAASALSLSAPPVAQALWNYDLPALEALARGLVRDGAIVRATVVGEDGTPLVDAQRPGVDTTPAALEFSEVALRTPARPEAIGVLRVGQSFSQVDAQIRRNALQRLPWELLKILAIVVGMLFVVHRLVTRRLVFLAQAVRNLAGAAPDARLPLRPHDERLPDEIVVLGKALNHLLDERLAETRRREQAEAQLREGLHERTAILGSLRDGLLALDASLSVRYANEAAARMLGAPLYELSRRGSLSQLATVAGHEGPQDLAHWLSVHLGQREAHTERLTLQPSEGAAFEAQAQLTPVTGARDVAWIVVISDISDAVRTREAEQARAAAEAASQAKTEFLSRMSHELRTPLNAIVGFAQSLSQDPLIQQDAQRREGVALIERAGWHLTGMIGDVLDLSRIESGRLKLSIGPVDLVPLARDAQAFVAAEAQRDGVRCELHVAEDARWVLADPVRVEQVLVNLLSNAVKYNRPGGTVTLRTRRSREGSRVRITVSDTGLGMTPEQMDNLFQSFNRLGRENSGKPGAGIGLVVTRTLVTLMGGKLTVRSVPSEGSEFTVTLPLSQPAGHAVEEELLAGPELRQDARPRALLYIEDDAVNALVMAALVGRRPDLSLHVCHSLAEGRERLRTEVPDLLLLDMQLPDGRGLDLLDELSRHPKLHRLPVVMVSADAMDESVNAALAAGARAYVTKPLAFDEVLHQIDAVMSGATTTTGGLL